MGPIPLHIGDMKVIKYQQEMVEEDDIVRFFCVCVCSSLNFVK